MSDSDEVENAISIASPFQISLSFCLLITLYILFVDEKNITIDDIDADILEDEEVEVEVEEDERILDNDDDEGDDDDDEEIGDDEDDDEKK